MNRKLLIYSSILIGTTTGLILGFSPLKNTLIQIPAIAQNSTTQTQNKLQNSQDNTHHPKGSSTPESSGMEMKHHQQMDRHFIEMMIPHHQGALDMANLASSKAKHPEIKKLAEAIKKDQNREIDQMKVWYKQWYGTEVPASSNMGMSMNSGMNQEINHGMPSHSGMNMMGMNMMEMMSTDLEALKNAPDFDKAFIEAMIPHHKMAVMMAAMVLDSQQEEMRELAKNIIHTQSAEIEQMWQWHQTWYQ